MNKKFVYQVGNNKEVMFIDICAIANKFFTLQHIACSPLCRTVCSNIRTIFKPWTVWADFKLRSFVWRCRQQAGGGGVGREDPANRDRVPASWSCIDWATALSPCRLAWLQPPMNSDISPGWKPHIHTHSLSLSLCSCHSNQRICSAATRRPRSKRISRVFA